MSVPYVTRVRLEGRWDTEDTLPISRPWTFTCMSNSHIPDPSPKQLSLLVIQAKNLGVILGSPFHSHSFEFMRNYILGLAFKEYLDISSFTAF